MGLKAPVLCHDQVRFAVAFENVAGYCLFSLSDILIYCDLWSNHHRACKIQLNVGRSKKVVFNNKNEGKAGKSLLGCYTTPKTKLTATAPEN